VTTDASGHVSFNVTLPTLIGEQLLAITATATNLTPDPSAQAGAVNVFNTSEFSAAIPVTNQNAPFIALALDAGSTPRVQVMYTVSGLTTVHSFLAFDPGFKGGVRIALGDVNGDGIPDIIVAAGPGGGPHVKVIDGSKLSMVDANTNEIEDTALIGQFFAYDPGFAGGVFVAFGHAAGGHPEIITGAGAGGGPHVKVFDATKLNQLQNALLGEFYAYSPFFSGGVTVAAADLTSDGILDIVTGAGPGGGPHVKVIDGTKLDQLQSNAEIADSALIGQFYAGTPSDNDGVFVAANSNIGHPIVVTSHAVGFGPVQVFDATKLNMLNSDSEPTGTAVLGSFFAYDPNVSAMGNSAHVAALDFNGDGVADILIGPGKTVVAEPLEIVDGTKLTDVDMSDQILPSAILDSFFAFTDQFGSTEGIFVAGA
jgi:hypothetical protein